MSAQVWIRARVLEIAVFLVCFFSLLFLWILGWIEFPSWAYAWALACRVCAYRYRQRYFVFILAVASWKLNPLKSILNPLRTRQILHSALDMSLIQKGAHFSSFFLEGPSSLAPLQWVWPFPAFRNPNLDLTLRNSSWLLRLYHHCLLFWRLLWNDWLPDSCLSDNFSRNDACFSCAASDSVLFLIFKHLRKHYATRHGQRRSVAPVSTYVASFFSSRFTPSTNSGIESLGEV